MIRHLIDSLKSSAIPTASQSDCSSTEAPDTGALLTLSPKKPVAPYMADIDAMANCAEAAVEALDIDLIAWLKSDLARLKQSWDLACQSEFETGNIRVLYRASHDLNGMAASYGYPDIGRVARSLCRILGRAQARKDAALINLHIEACRVIFAEDRDSSDRQALTAELCDRLEANVEQALTA